MTETDAARTMRAHGPTTRLRSAEAIAAAAPAALAAPASVALAGLDAPLWAIGVLALSVVPSAALALHALTADENGGIEARWHAAAAAPLAAAAAWLAWSTGGALSPAMPWALAALAPIALFGGVYGPAAASIAAAAMGTLFVLGPDSPTPFSVFAARDAREAAAALSWTASAATIAVVASGAHRAWTRALPALDHPTAAARAALADLAHNARAVDLSFVGNAVSTAVGAPEDALDLDRDAVIGLTLADFVHPDDVDAAAAVLAAGDGATSIRVRTRSGGFRWVDARAVDGRLIVRGRWDAGSGTTDDAPQGDAPDPRERIAETVGAGVLAHMRADLRDGLKSVVGYLEILKNELLGPLGGERYRDYAGRAHDGSARALALVDEILDLAEIEGGRADDAPELVDPAPLIEAAVRLSSDRAAAAGVTVDAEIPPNTPFVRADRRALRRVLANMLLDAVARARIGDAVRLEAAPETDAIRFSAVAAPAAGPGASDAPLAIAGPVAATGNVGRKAAQTSADGAGATRLGRLAARTLAERMGGEMIFGGGVDGDAAIPAGAGGARIFSETILPLPKPKDAAQTG